MMSVQSVLAQFLTALTGPWATGIAMVLLVWAGAGLIYDADPWVNIVVRTVAAIALLMVSANLLSALGLIGTAAP